MSENAAPTVSVVIPTYNRAHLVTRAIQSVLDQTYDGFELIVVDDASVDDIRKVVSRFNDERVRCIRHSENRGGAAARNTGIEAANGQFVAFLDDDDEWLPHHLAVCVKAIEELPREWGLVYTGYLVVTDRKVVEFYPRLKGRVHKQILTSGSPSALPTFLVRRRCFEKVGLFDERFPRHQDWEMHIRLARVYQYYPVPEISVKVHRSPSPSVEKVRLAKRMLQEKYSEEVRALGFLDKRRFYASHYNRLAQLHFEEGNLRRGSHCLIKALVQYPFRLRRTLSTVRRALAAAASRLFLAGNGPS